MQRMGILSKTTKQDEDVLVGQPRVAGHGRVAKQDLLLATPLDPRTSDDYDMAAFLEELDGTPVWRR